MYTAHNNFMGYKMRSTTITLRKTIYELYLIIIIIIIIMLKKVHCLQLTSARTRDHSPSNAFNTRTYFNVVEKVARAHLGKLYTLTRRRKQIIGNEKWNTVKFLEKIQNHRLTDEHCACTSNFSIFLYFENIRDNKYALQIDYRLNPKVSVFDMFFETFRFKRVIPYCQTIINK